MAYDWWDLAELPSWFNWRQKEEQQPKPAPPDFGASALNSGDIAYFLRQGQKQRQAEGPAPNPDPFADLNKWSRQQDEKATWTDRRNAPLDPWVQQYQRQKAQMGPQPRQDDADFYPWLQEWFNKRAAVQVAEQRNEEITAEPLRATQNEPYESMLFQATKPQYGTYLGPLAAPAWAATGGKAPDVGAAWRNATRLPGAGPLLEQGARWFGQGTNLLGLPQDLSVSTRLPNGVSLGEYAGAMRDTALQNFQAFGQEVAEDWRTALPDFFQGRQTETLDAYQRNLRAMQAASPNNLTGEFARLNALGGAENVAATYQDLSQRDAAIAETRALASQLNSIGADFNQDDAIRAPAQFDAARYGAEATDLERMTPAQIVDKRMPIVENIAFSFILDPLEWAGWVGGLAQLTSKASRIRAGTAAVPDQARAARVFDELIAGTEGARVAEKVGGSASSINPFALTKEAAADIDAATLFTTHMQLLQDVGTREDARSLLMTLITNPAQLVRGGVAGLVSPRLVEQADEAGRVLFGGFAANKDAVQARRVYEQIAPRILELPALQGDGVLDKMALIGQLDDLVNDGAKVAHGVNPLNLPAGMMDVRKVPTSTGEYTIEYLGPMKTVIQTEGPMTAERATRRLSEIEKGPKPNYLQRIAGAQRAFTSELYLNMRPGHWVRNGASALGHLLTDNAITLEPTNQLWDYITTKTGGVRPTRRLNEAAGGVAAMTETGHKSMFPGLLGKFSELGQRIWTGDGSVDIGKALSIPVGEQNFYLRAFTTTMREAFDRNWRRDIQRSLGAALDTAGVDPALRGAIISAVTDAGLQGGRADVAERLRMVTEGQVLPFAPEAFGVPADALTPEGWREVQGILQDATPVDVKRMRIDEVFDRDTQRYAGVTNEAPPTPGRYAWTDAEAEDDTASLIDEARKAAQRSGQDPEEAARQAQELMGRKAQIEQEGLDAVRQAAQNTDNPEALRTMIDVWVDVFELKRQTRTANALAVDDVLAGVGDWGEYFSTAMRNWSTYNERVAGVFAGAVTDLADIAAGKVRQGGRDAWEMLRRFLNYDERAVTTARQLQPTSPAYDSETFKRVIDANRAFVDREVARAWAAARRYMDAETLDILMSAERDTQRMGAQVAAYVGDERARMLAKEMQLDEYYGVRNQSWKELAEAQAARWRAAQYEIVKSKKDASMPAAGVSFVEDADWPGMEREAVLVRRVAAGPDGVQRWEVQDAEGGLRIVPENEIPKEAVAEFNQRQQALDAQVEAEVNALGQEVQERVPPTAPRDDVAMSFDGPAHPSIDRERDPDAWNAWVRFANENPDLAQRRVDDYNARRAQVQQRANAAYKDRQPLFGEQQPEVDFGMGEARQAPPAQPDPELQDAVDWRLLRGMKPERVAQQVGVSPDAVNARRIILVDNGLIYSADAEGKVFSRRRGGSIFKLNPDGRRRLKELDQKFVGSASAERPQSTALIARQSQGISMRPPRQIEGVWEFPESPVRETVRRLPDDLEIVDGQFRYVGDKLTGPRLGEPPRITATNVKGEPMAGPGIPMGGPGQRRLPGPTEKPVKPTPAPSSSSKPSTVGTKAAAQLGDEGGRVERLTPPAWYGDRYANATHVIQMEEGGAVYPVRVLESGVMDDATGYTDEWIDQGNPYAVVQFLADELPEDEAARAAKVGEPVSDSFRQGDVREYGWENAPYRLQPLSESERARLTGQDALMPNVFESVGAQVRDALARAFAGDSVDVSEIAPVGADAIEAIRRGPKQWELPPHGLTDAEKYDWYDLQSSREHWAEQARVATSDAERRGAQSMLDDVDNALEDLRAKEMFSTAPEIEQVGTRSISPDGLQNVPPATADTEPNLYLAEMRDAATDDLIQSATNPELKAAIRAIGDDFYRGLNNVQKDVVRRFVSDNVYDRDDALDVVRAHRDYWVQRAQREAMADTQRSSRLESLYGGQTLEELRVKLAEMDRQIETLRKAGAGEFTGQGTRRAGAATSNEAARNLGEEKMALESYMRQKFGEFDRTIGNDVRTPTAPAPTRTQVFEKGQAVRNINTGEIKYVSEVIERDGEITSVITSTRPDMTSGVATLPPSILEPVEDASQALPELRRLGVDEAGDALLEVSPEDIDYQTAYQAFTGTSFTPERRAQQRQKDYVNEMEWVTSVFEKFADTPERRAEIKAALERYRDTYLQKYTAMLRSRHGLVSTMIAGPANFPVRQMEKKIASSDKRLNEFLEWNNKAIHRLRLDFDPKYVSRRGISADDADAPAQLAARIAAAEQEQERMKAANSILRSKRTSEATKIQRLAELEIPEPVARSMMKGDFAGRKGYAQFQLSNNLANIKRMKQRLADMEKLRADDTFEMAFEGGRILDNVEDNRLQIFFDDKPAADLRTKLKQNGFKWAPSKGAWQRMRNASANEAARRVLGVEVKAPAQAAEQVVKAQPFAWQAPEIEDVWKLSPEEYAEKAGVLWSVDEFARRIEDEGGSVVLHYGINNASERWQKGDPLMFTVEKTAAGPEIIMQNGRTDFKMRIKRMPIDYLLITEEYPHRASVQAAIDNGVEVDESVLRRYPNIAKQQRAEMRVAEDARRAAETSSPATAQQTPTAAAEAAPTPKQEGPIEYAPGSVETAKGLLPWEMLKSNRRKGWDGRVTEAGDLISDGASMIVRDAITNRRQLEAMDVMVERAQKLGSNGATQTVSRQMWDRTLSAEKVPARIVGYSEKEDSQIGKYAGLWLVSDTGQVAQVNGDKLKYLHFVTGFDEIAMPVSTEIVSGAPYMTRPLVLSRDGEPVAILMGLTPERDGELPDVATMLERAMPADGLPSVKPRKATAAATPATNTAAETLSEVTPGGKRRAYTGTVEELQVTQAGNTTYAVDFDAGVKWKTTGKGSDKSYTVYFDTPEGLHYVTGLKTQRQSEKLAKNILAYATIIEDDGKVYVDPQLLYRYQGRLAEPAERKVGKQVAAYLKEAESPPEGYAGEAMRFDAPANSENFVKAGVRPLAANQTGLTKAQRDYMVERLAEAAQLIRDERASAVTIQIPAGGEVTVRNLAQVQRVQKVMGGKLDIVRTYDFNVPRPDFEKFGIAPGESLIDAILNKVNPKRKATKGTQAPEIGDMAAYRALYGDAARAQMNERLDAILAGTPNRLTPAQRQVVMNWAAQEGLPMFDDALARSVEGARRVADFSMLNYAKRRNVDTFLSYLVPYHYWMTRSSLNWIERTLMKPQWASRYARWERTSNQDVENRGLPDRFKGTLPIPGTDYRIGNPISLMLPYAQLYARTPFDEPVETDNMVGKVYENMKALGLGLLPVYDMLYLGATGQKDRIRPFFWPDQLAYRTQEVMGVREPWTPETAIRKQFGLAPTDEWDPYRQAREVAAMAQRGEISPRLASWAIDAIVAKQRGEDALPMTPEGLDPIVAEAQKSAAGKRLLTMVTSNIMGLPVYEVDPAEVELRRANAARGAMKYGPDNQYGSMAGSNTLFDMFPGLGPWMDRSTTIPGNEDWDRPGLKAAQSDMYDQRGAIYDQMNAAVEEAYGANPNLTYEERSAIEQPYRAQIDALEAQYAEIPSPSPSAGNGRAPWEIQERAWEDLLAEYAYNYPGRPEYTPGNYQAYATARAQWEQERAAALTAAAQGAGLGRFLSGTDANTAIEGYLDRFKGPNQLAAEGKGATGTGTGRGTGGTWTGGSGGTGGTAAAMSDNVRELMGEYYAMDSWDDKRMFLLTTGAELAAYWKEKYGGGLMWWEVGRRTSAPSWWTRGGGGRGGDSSGVNTRPPQVYPRELDRSLWYRDQRQGYQAPNNTDAWLNAGAALRYRKMGG